MIVVKRVRTVYKLPMGVVMSVDRQRVIILDNGRPVQIECSKCHMRKELDAFGLRQMPDGSIRNQPRCRDCRSSRKGRGAVQQLKLAFRRVEKAGMPLPHQLIVACLRQRRRNQDETTLTRLAQQARVDYRDALAFGRLVERDGAGTLIAGRRGRPTRIKWRMPLTEYVAAVNL